jgi:hypothetical protein
MTEASPLIAAFPAGHEGTWSQWGNVRFYCRLILAISHQLRYLEPCLVSDAD